jgi:hypothetical protein
VAGVAIVSVAEGGAGVAWQATFGAADPSAVRDTLGGSMFPGSGKTARFTVATALNLHFTSAAMAIPGNDFFIGNDSPTEYELVNSSDNLQTSTVTGKAHEIWNAGSEVFDSAAAAFLVVGNKDLRALRNSVVARNFAEFYGFNSLSTAAGYTVNSQRAANNGVCRISFSAVAVPGWQSYALTLTGLRGIGWQARRRQATGR